ncbi:MAG: hypothetical protein H5U38_01730 [Calditrichaeota bacterium]|nr:hypothetical protein [Calditrichota bacterium]
MSVRAACSEDGCAAGGWEVKEHRVFTYDRASERVTSVVSDEIPDTQLRKATQYVCWDLAEVFKDAHYGGDSFRFSQATQGAGYFHKVIWNLSSSQSCCLQNYPGGFNDCISSHSWASVGWYPYQTTPHKLQVWKHANRSGPSHTFENGHQDFDDDWEGEIWWQNGIPESINDKVSSIDMMYWVSYAP